MHNSMMNWIVWAISVWVLVTPSPVHAVDLADDHVLEERDSGGLRRRELKLEGLTGYWFRDDITRAIAADKSELISLRSRADLYKVTLEVQDARVERLTELLQVSEESYELALGSQADLERRWLNAEERVIEERERTQAWFRAPMLWFSLGVFVTGAAAVTLVVVASEK